MSELLDLDQLQAEPYAALPEDVRALVAEVRRLRAERDAALRMHQVQFERANRVEAERDEARAALQRIRDATGRLSDIAETLLYDGDRDQPCAGYVEVYGVIDWLGAIAAAEPGGRLTCSVCGALPLGIHNEEMHAAAEPGEQGGEQ